MVGRRNKVLAAAALWGACAWFLSLDVDFLITNLRSAPHWLLQVFRALFMGVSVAVGYVIYRKYLLEIRTRGEKYAEIRVQIRRLLAVLLRRPLACTTHKLPESRFVRESKKKCPIKSSENCLNSAPNPVVGRESHLAVQLSGHWRAGYALLPCCWCGDLPRWA